MKIVADENIPLVEYYFGGNGEVILKPGREIRKSDLMDADILLVRSVTKVNKALLEGTRVKWVGSATSGYDHLDTRWLDEQGIGYRMARGCNTIPVVEYVIVTILTLQKMGFLRNKKCRAGVIGVGSIGSRVVQALKRLGFEVLQCDPLRAESEKNFSSASIHDIAECDFISLHVPLTKNELHATYHMINKDFLLRQKKDSVILNTARGEVISFDDLKAYGEKLIICLDVWENEPWIDFDVLKIATLATPHIAGYSVQAKYRGIKMIYDALITDKIISPKKIKPMDFPSKTISFSQKKVDWRDIICEIYDPLKTTKQMKTLLIEDEKFAFDKMRKQFVDRYEFAYVKMIDLDVGEKEKVFLKELINVIFG